MRFEYTGIIASAPDTGDAVAVFRPEVRIMVHGPKGQAVYRALVDTGSDNTIFPARVVRDPGIPVQQATGPAAQTFGGHKLAMSYADVELELIHATGNLRWIAQVYFASAGVEQETAILGHDGCLEFFTARFIGDEFALELEANEYLPTNAGY